MGNDDAEKREKDAVTAGNRQLEQIILTRLSRADIMNEEPENL